MSFLPEFEDDPLYIVMDDCSRMTDIQKSALKLFNCIIKNILGKEVICVNPDAKWRDNVNLIDSEIYCGWRDTPCRMINGKLVQTTRAQKHVI